MTVLESTESCNFKVTNEEHNITTRESILAIRRFKDADAFTMTQDK